MQVYVEETEDAPASPVSGSEGQPSGAREKSPEPNAGPSSEKTAEEINLQWTPPSQPNSRAAYEAGAVGRTPGADSGCLRVRLAEKAEIVGKIGRLCEGDAL
ncbi:hypothetical protein IscW_ISCW011608 [Ixodes scapularis]|uniref:Uncharacterized protein n=1 Tax=Ixodes scapularis TaxID=6945 RepID=B7Q4E6_IXOSC|nr:hypothetical protein IscW_ISCW011608 [Ixodes scapularis]|eukprot:XP_002411527.1 hypothetical protein IscW_ISCW011608 [Ixodes scapularis]